MQPVVQGISLPRTAYTRKLQRLVRDRRLQPDETRSGRWADDDAAPELGVGMVGTLALGTGSKCQPTSKSKAGSRQKQKWRGVGKGALQPQSDSGEDFPSEAGSDTASEPKRPRRCTHRGNSGVTARELFDVHGKDWSGGSCWDRSSRVWIAAVPARAVDEEEST